MAFRFRIDPARGDEAKCGIYAELEERGLTAGLDKAQLLAGQWTTLEDEEQRRVLRALLLRLAGLEIDEEDV